MFGLGLPEFFQHLLLSNVGNDREARQLCL